MTQDKTPSDALAPCPFCGAQPDDCNVGQFVVECPSCAITGPASENSNAARLAWNIRWGSPVVAGEPREMPQGAITAAVMRNDGGDAPAFCLMVAYRSEKDALDALQLLNDTHPDVRSGYADGWQDGASEAARLLADDTTTTQPTQAQAGAVPMTPFIPAQRERLFYNRPENVGKSLGMADWHRIVQYIESAHGIKEGAQHADQ